MANITVNTLGDSMADRIAVAVAGSDNTLESTEAPFRSLDPALELRNRVYRFANVDKQGHVEVNDSGYQRSPLLQTCHQFRNETLEMYYSGKSFLVMVRNYDMLKALVPQWGVDTWNDPSMLQNERRPTEHRTVLRSQHQSAHQNGFNDMPSEIGSK
ncbi:hypothetical protein LTR08_003390 [Meristemomyces frigidus]|nr:hypothetical protein LTR08_003390 [Meristemomyces frigidus]